jgi:predicted amidohydrolase YtcJ
MQMQRLACILVAMGCLFGCSVRSEPADLIIRNARVYTLDPDQPWAQAIAVAKERIVYVGSNDGTKPLETDKTRIIDAEGQLVLPGFIDSHNHITSGSNPNVLSLSGSKNLSELQERVKSFAQDHPDLSWIEAYGWNYSVLPNNRLPRARDLAGLTGGRPAILTAYDGHTNWLNEEALKLLGISAETDDALFGELVRDSADQPTGVIVNATFDDEDSPWNHFLPEYDPEDVYQSLKKNLADAVRFGITTIVDPQAGVDNLPLFDRALEEGALKSWLHIALYHRVGTTDETIEIFEGIRKSYGQGRIRTPALKFYIDDVIEPYSAALLEPYADRPEERGYTFYDEEDFTRILTKLDQRGFQLFIHAIGDRGIRTALNALEAARKTNGSDNRHQLVHVELLSPEDIPRFKRLNVVACMQPRHLSPDITGQWAAAVGPERSQYAWALRSLKDSGATLAFSSDWYVAEMNPMIGIYTAVTRKRLDGTGEAWIPEQRISVEEAVEGYTLGGAYANNIEDDRGSIEKGKYADLVVLSRDLFNIPPNEIKDVRVLLTMVRGEIVYRHD